MITVYDKFGNVKQQINIAVTVNPPTEYTDGDVAPAHPKGMTMTFNKSGTMKSVSDIDPFPVQATISTAGLATSANQVTANSSLASIKTNTDPLVAAAGGGYIRQDSTGTIAKETGGNLAAVKTNTDPLVAAAGGGYIRQDSTGTIAKETGGNLAAVKTNTDPLVAAAGGGYIRQDSTGTIAKETGGNLASVKTNTDSIKTNTDPLVAAAGGGYIRQDSTGTIAKETGGNLAAVKTNTDPLVAAAGGGYIRQDSTATIAKETGGNLDAIKTSLQSIDLGIPTALGQNTMANSMPVVIASDQFVQTQVSLTTGAVTDANEFPIKSIDSEVVSAFNNKGQAAIILNDKESVSNWCAVVTGDWAGELLFEASVDNQNWDPVNGVLDNSDFISTTTTRNGTYRGNVAGMKAFRVQSIRWVSGTANIVARVGIGTGGVFISNPLPPGSNIIGQVNTPVLVQQQNQIIELLSELLIEARAQTGIVKDGLNVPGETNQLRRDEEPNIPKLRVVS